MTVVCRICVTSLRKHSLLPPRIREIPAPAFQDLHSLEWVKLFNNDLRTLTYELMEPVLDTLMHIDIHSEYSS